MNRFVLFQTKMIALVEFSFYPDSATLLEFPLLFLSIYVYVNASQDEYYKVRSPIRNQTLKLAVFSETLEYYRNILYSINAELLLRNEDFRYCFRQL